MKHVFCFLGLLCLFFEVGAQENIKKKDNTAAVGAVAGYTALKPGDHVPDVLMRKVLNGGNIGGLRLSDFRGKLLIIDFWATSCGACIQAMPRLDSIVDKFNGRLVVLPVTAELSDRIVAFQRTNSFLKGRKFRTVVEDKGLGQLFPHRMLPHEVWINGEGVLLGFTEGAEVTPERVAQVLSGQGLSLKMKEDLLNYDDNKPLLISGNGGPDSIYRYRSVITGMLKGLPSGLGFSYDSVRQVTVVRATNVSARDLYTMVYRGVRALRDKQVDMGKVSGLYCYELDLPSISPALVRRSIREDLDRYFGLRSEFTGTAFRLLPPGDTGMDDGPLSL